MHLKKKINFSVFIMEDTLAIWRVPSTQFPILAWELGTKDSVFFDECVQYKKLVCRVSKEAFLRHKLRKRLILLLKLFLYLRGKEERFLKNKKRHPYP